jgi:hypothetical protein
MSKKPFFVMGCLDAIGAAMQVLATVYLPGTLLVLIPQAAIPLSMCAGSLILRERYTLNQYLGACVVFFGILVVLYPIVTHQNEADYYCQAKDLENDCVLCEVETTKEDCLSHVREDGTIGDHSDDNPFWILTGAGPFTNSTNKNTSNHSDHGHHHGNDDDQNLYYCSWVSRKDSIKQEDWLVFVWSIVMLVSCVPSVMSTVYKQVALQAPLDPILVNGWVALFQFICGMFLVVPSGLASSPKVHPVDLGTNWRNAMQCLFSQTNSVHSGCHPDDCFRAALWVHLSLVNSAIYSLAMIFVLKYGGCDLMYLGLTLVVPLGHLAFSFHSSFSTTTRYDILGLIVLVAGLVLFRFGYERVGTSTIAGETTDQPIGYEPLGTEEADTTEDSNTHGTNEGSRRLPMATSNGKEGFLEFLREPFMLVGDI